LPVENSDVHAEVEGIIEDIRVDEGAVVHKGDLIARLSDRDYRAELRKVAADIDEKQAKLKMLKAGPRTEELTLARTTVERASERLRYAETRHEMYKKLFADGLTSKKELNEVEEEFSVRG